MNLVVNKKGVLQFMQPTQVSEPQQQDYQNEEQYYQQQYAQPILPKDISLELLIMN